jgi:hypothetical protein
LAGRYPATVTALAGRVAVTRTGRLRKDIHKWGDIHN